MGKTTDLATGGWLEIGTGVALAIAAEPIHELGHAVAAWLATGAWPKVGLWAIRPMGQSESTGAMLAVLAAGEAAVIGWWAFVYLIARWQPQRRWALLGPTFMAALGLLNWFAAAVLSPFGHSAWGASDAVKFMAVSSLGWMPVAMSVAIVCCVIALATWRCLARQPVTD